MASKPILKFTLCCGEYGNKNTEYLITVKDTKNDHNDPIQIYEVRYFKDITVGELRKIIKDGSVKVALVSGEQLAEALTHLRHMGHKQVMI